MAQPPKHQHPLLLLQNQSHKVGSHVGKLFNKVHKCRQLLRSELMIWLAVDDTTTRQCFVNVPFGNTRYVCQRQQHYHTLDTQVQLSDAPATSR